VPTRPPARVTDSGLASSCRPGRALHRVGLEYLDEAVDMARAPGPAVRQDLPRLTSATTSMARLRTSRGQEPRIA